MNTQMQDDEDFPESVADVRTDEDRLEALQQKLRDRDIDENLIEKDDFLRKIRRGDAPGFELAVVPTTLPERPISKSLVVSLLQDDWPRIESALKNAHRTELSKAKAGRRGWFLTEVIKYGREHKHLKFPLRDERILGTTRYRMR